MAVAGAHNENAQCAVSPPSATIRAVGVCETAACPARRRGRPRHGNAGFASDPNIAPYIEAIYGLRKALLNDCLQLLPFVIVAVADKNIRGQETSHAGRGLF
jgi:hypothetical protein